MITQTTTSTKREKLIITNKNKMTPTYLHATEKGWHINGSKQGFTSRAIAEAQIETNILLNNIR